jgi:ribosome maturation factor RimP
MEEMEFAKFKGKEVLVLVKYGFKKKTEETQSYEGKLIRIDRLSVILERRIGDGADIVVNDFFPWHNIDAIRHRIKG